MEAQSYFLDVNKLKREAAQHGAGRVKVCTDKRLLGETVFQGDTWDELLLERMRSQPSSRPYIAMIGALHLDVSLKQTQP